MDLHGADDWLGTEVVIELNFFSNIIENSLETRSLEIHSGTFKSIQGATPLEKSLVLSEVTVRLVKTELK